MTDTRVDEAPRKHWYGDGEQPWDSIVRLGWGPAFAAANVLKYVRRVKDPDHSLESARWYYARLYERAAKLDDPGPRPPLRYDPAGLERLQERTAVVFAASPWAEALFALEDELTQGELMLIRREPG